MRDVGGQACGGALANVWSFLRPVFFIPAVLALAACANPTPYQSADDTGYGYAVTQIGENRFRVTFSGNRLTPRETVESFLLYRAAELTLQQGGTAFEVEDKDTERFPLMTTTGPRRWDGLDPGWGWGWGWGGPGPYGYRPYGYGGPIFGMGAFGMGWYDAPPGPVTTTVQFRYTASATILMRTGAGPWQDPRVYDARSVIRFVGPAVVRSIGEQPSGESEGTGKAGSFRGGDTTGSDPVEPKG